MAKQLSGMNPLPSLIRASGWDAGNRRMRAAGRTKWSRGDYNAAAAEQSRLVATCYGEGPEGCVRFGFAGQLEQRGLLDLYTKDYFGEFEGFWQQYCAQFEAKTAR